MVFMIMMLLLWTEAILSLLNRRGRNGHRDLAKHTGLRLDYWHPPKADHSKYLNWTFLDFFYGSYYLGDIFSHYRHRASEGRI